jgi:hypothetical protein
LLDWDEVDTMSSCDLSSLNMLTAPARSSTERFERVSRVAPSPPLPLTERLGVPIPTCQLNLRCPVEAGRRVPSQVAPPLSRSRLAGSHPAKSNCFRSPAGPGCCSTSQS